MDLDPIISTIFKKAQDGSLSKQTGTNYAQIRAQIKHQRKENIAEVEKRARAIEAFFLGPRGENGEFFKKLIEDSVYSHIQARKSYEMEDKKHITREMQHEKSFLQAQDALERGLNYLNTKLADLSPPYYSTRYFGHMCWQTSIPAMVGYFSTMLYNPNNTAFEASPFTTQLEIECLKRFAEMFHYPKMLTSLKGQSGTQASWGHLTCGGTIANSEAFWAARSVKYLAFGLKKYVQSLTGQALKDAQDAQVKLATGESKNLLSCSVWELLNVPSDETMVLYENIYKMVYPNGGEAEFKKYQNDVGAFTLGKWGFINLYNSMEKENKQIPDEKWQDNKVPSPISFYSATGHYSIPKAVSLLGMGEQSIHKIEVDLDSRMDCVKLEEELNKCNQNHIPVLVVVGIVGTTEESSVDNLIEILNIKERMMKKGLFFHFHIDGAYGAYFVSMIRGVESHLGQNVSASSYVRDQLNVFKHSDSITFDPHKTGYVPYSCGGIIYRNYRLRNNLSFSAPYIFSGFEPNNAIYGIEGSKPGASVSAVYLSLLVMPLIRNGHGELLERTMMNTKVFTASLYGMKDKEFTEEGKEKKFKFKCCLLPRSYVEKHNCHQLQEEQDAAYKKIAETPIKDIASLINDPKIQKYYLDIGPDLNIVCYCVNFFDEANNCWNTSLKKLNDFNRTLVRISKPVGSDVSVRLKDLYVSETTVSHSYGQPLFNDFLRRNGLQNDDDSIEFIRSTIMNPFFTQQAENAPNATFINELAQNSIEVLKELSKNYW